MFGVWATAACVLNARGLQRHELKEVNRETLQQKWVNDYTATIDILLKGGESANCALAVLV